MSSALAMILAAGIAVGNGPEKESGEVQLEFPPGSTWVSVEGWKGSKKVVEASVTFKSGNKVEIGWEVRIAGNASFSSTAVREYRIDRRTKSPVILPRSPDMKPLDRGGVFRPVGHRLELQLWDDSRFMRDYGLLGELVLVLKRSK
jgi:hypothetical protein